jgi:aspartate oxidase
MESRGSHCRSDYPDTEEKMAAASIVTYDGGAYRVRLDKEYSYES